MSEKLDLQPIPEMVDGMKILVIVAHHDDIEFGIGGSVPKWTKAGADVTYVIITDGGAGSNEVGVIRADLVARRKEEQIKAGEAVGVTDIRFLGYKDGELEPTIDLRRDLTRIIREVQPYRVVCQDPQTVLYSDSYINHPDHRAAGTAALYATFPSSESRPIFAELLDEGFEPHKVSELYLTLTLKPTHFEDITEHIEDKIASLRAHVSQLGEGDDFENRARNFITKRNAETGERVGVGYAELFRVMKFDKPAEDEESNTDES